MKKLLTLCLLFVLSSSVNAQQMNFEETVKYINDKIECCADGSKMTISAKPNGEIKWESGLKYRINLFDLVPYPSTSTLLLMENNGIMLWTYTRDYEIHFQISKKDSKLLTEFNSKADAERVYKALVHLRSLCTKEKDPF